MRWVCGRGCFDVRSVGVGAREGKGKGQGDVHRFRPAGECYHVRMSSGCGVMD